MVDVSGIPRRRSPGDLGRAVRDQGRAIEQQGSARRLQSASIGKPDEGQVFLASDGQRFVDEEGVERIRFSTSDGAADFDGPVSIQGPLTLRPGSIENDSLASPVSFDAKLSNSGALDLTTNEQTICEFSITVPPGFTQALVSATGSIGIVNPLPDESSIGGRVYISHPSTGDWWGPRRFQGVQPGNDGAVFPAAQEDFTGLQGGQQIRVRMVAMATNDWGATQGGGTLNGFAIFRR